MQGRYCGLSLWYENFEHPIFDTSFENIESIVSEGNRLIIHQTNQDEDVIVYYKSIYTLTSEKYMPKAK